MAETLPTLREELDLLRGPHLPDGQPTWTLHDPLRNQFFQLDWPSFEILRRWHLGDAASIVDDVRNATTLQIGVGDVEALANFLQDNQLFAPARGSAARYAESLQRRRGSKAGWLLHHYLFFRLPLVRPDAWLERWSPHIGFLFSPLFLRLTLLVAIFGLVGIYRQWEPFSSTLVDMLSLEGMLAYGCTLACVKVLHELGHGFMAKRFGCRVPTMGVAFLVLWPVAYTDTNEVWRLTRHDLRLKVAVAGIATELVVAVWATLAWVLLPEGLPKSIAFLLSTTTWVSTVLINASPFMRFDGYFLLSDALNMPNLHARAFALARWDLRERLFALGEPLPEHFPPLRHALLILFAWATWLYRLVLFLGIAWMVYQFFIKAVGILLFAVEIVWFIAMPLWNELKVWKMHRAKIRQSGRARRSLLLLAAVVALFLVPWPGRVMTSGLLQPEEELVLYAPPRARVVALPHADQATVEAGEMLIVLESPDLDMRRQLTGARREQLSWQSASAGFDPEQRKDWQVLGEQLASARAEVRTVSADAVRYAPVAPYRGALRDLDPDLRVGDWVARDELLARLVREGPRQVVTYVDDEAVHRLAVGDSALFVSDSGAGPTLRLEIASIDSDASRILGEPELASTFGGHVLVREKDGQLYPERAMYRVLLHVLDGDPLPQYAWRGSLSMVADWEAPATRFFRAAASVVVREAGF